MAQEIWIPASIGRRIDVSAGQKIVVIDVRGGQAADFCRMHRQSGGVPLHSGHN